MGTSQGLAHAPGPPECFRQQREIVRQPDLGTQCPERFNSLAKLRQAGIPIAFRGSRPARQHIRRRKVIREGVAAAQFHSLPAMLERRAALSTKDLQHCCVVERDGLAEGVTQTVR